MQFYEQVSGARMHSCYFRPGGVAYDLPLGFLDKVFIFTEQFSSRIEELEIFLKENRIWKQRLINVGVISKELNYQYAMSGVLLRGSGIKWDLRVTQPYEIYNRLNFLIPCGVKGDCYDRFNVRIEEMKQSVTIIIQCLNLIPFGPIKVNNKVSPPSKFFLNNSMESVIDFFKLFSSGFLVPRNSVYSSIESPKGELGVFLFSDQTGIPYRCKVRSPGYYHLQILNVLAKNAYLADIVALIGTLDIVLGEIDR